MPGDTVWVVANPGAGNGRGARYASLVTKALHDAGIRCLLVSPSSVQGTTQAVAEAVAAGARAIVTCGGDGTVHAALPALVGSDVPLGIMAAGSGDDIALALGMPVHDAHEAAATVVAGISAGTSRRVDVGHAAVADGHSEYFLGVLSTGFDSAVNERANTMKRLGGQRYLAAIVKELTSFRAVPYDIDLDGRAVSGSAMLVAVGNGSSYGGGMLVCPGAVIDDGVLDVTWLKAVSTPTFLRALPSVYSGAHVKKPYVSTYRAARIRISAPGQIAYADGERIGPLPVVIGLRPGALRVLTC